MPVSWSPSPLIPPFRFGTVEPNVYRGAYPKQRNLRFLKRLKLRTVLSLIPDTPDDVFQAFCAQYEIHSIHLPVDKVKDNVPLTYNRAVEALQIIINQENLPIYVHCLDGASVTGLVICCLRKLQTWNISSAMGEFLRYLRGGVISSEESVFVEKFCSEIEISKMIPPWLWEGQINFKKHPTLKLNFTLAPTTGSSSASNITASSPSWSPQGTVVHLTNQQMKDSQGNGGTNNSYGASTVGDMPYGSTVNGMGSHSMMGSNSIASSVSAPTPLTLSKPGQLSNHVSRSSVKGGLRDRVGHNKGTIRTDISGSVGYGTSRTMSIATPITAALTPSKRGMIGHLSGSKQQQRKTQDSSAIDSSASSPGVRAMTLTLIPQTRSEVERPIPGTTRVQSSMGSHIISIVHSEHGSSIDGDTGAGKEGSLSGAGQKSEEISTDVSATVAQDRNSGVQMATKNSPAATTTTIATHEAVDEYYEVSMTLKALSLEGADF